MVTARDIKERLLSPAKIRELCRYNKLGQGGSAGYAPGYAQANLIVLPAKYAADFRMLCKRNPVPCPLLGETKVGDWNVPSELAANSDIRKDLGLYRIYQDGKTIDEVTNLTSYWSDDSVAFLIGCSHTFEDALVAAGFTLRHHEKDHIVPCYRTKVPLMQAGVFSGNMVVSMRPFKAEDVPLIQRISRPYTRAHGEPVAFGFDGAAALGLTEEDIRNPTWGSPVEIREGEVPVFWGCGVTPQQVVIDSKIPEKVFSHATGYMLVLDLKGEALCESP